MQRVRQANPYNPQALSARGAGEDILIRQFQFPDMCRDDEIVRQEWIDRLQTSWRWEPCEFIHILPLRSEIGSGIRAFLEKAQPEKILDFFEDLIEDDRPEDRKWTGFRILASVNRANGAILYAVQLFKKAKNSDTEVFSTRDGAPNIGPAGSGEFSTLFC